MGRSHSGNWLIGCSVSPGEWRTVNPFPNWAVRFDSLYSHQKGIKWKSQDVFDHVRGKKKFSLCKSGMSGYSAKTIKEEISKCEVRCQNCHIRRTAKQQNWWILGYAPIAQLDRA